MGGQEIGNETDNKPAIKHIAMAKLYMGICAAAAAVSLLPCASCTVEEKDPAAAATKDISVVAGLSSDTKTLIGDDGSAWWHTSGGESGSGEKLAVIETAGSSVSAYTTEEGVSTDGGKTMTFALTVSEVTAGEYRYSAFYPSSSLAAAPESAGEVSITLPSAQTPDVNSFDRNADVLLARTVSTTAQPDELEMEFRRVVAMCRLNITNLATTDPIDKILFSATKDGNACMLAGTTVFDLDSGANPDSWGSASTVTLDMSAINDTTELTGKMTDYSVSDFNWDEEALGDSTAPGRIKGDGVYFAVWPCTLGEGDTFTVEVSAGDAWYSRTVTVPSGRSVIFQAGHVGSMTVSMSSATVKSYGNYDLWGKGVSMAVGGVTLDPSSAGLTPVLVDSDLTLNDTSCQGKIYFVDPEARLTVASGARLSNTYIVSNNDNAKPTVALAGNHVFNMTGDASGTVSVGFKDMTIDSGKRTSNDVLFGITASNTGLDRFVLDGCVIEDTGGGNLKGLFYCGASSGQFIRTVEMTGCDWTVVAAADGNADQSNWLVMTGNMDNSSMDPTFESIIIRDNVFHSSASGAAWPMKLVPCSKTVFSSTDISGNVFLNVYSSGLVDIAGIADASIHDNLIYYDLDSAMPYAFRLLTSGADASGTVISSNNFAWCAGGGKSLIPTKFNGVSADTVRSIAAPFSAVSVADGTFTCKYILAECSSSVDSTSAPGLARVWHYLDYDNHKAYVRHTQDASELTGWSFGCIGGAAECALGGSWPSKTLTVKRESEEEVWSVELLDQLSGSDYTASFAGATWTPLWADEFNTLDSYDSDVWLRSTWGNWNSAHAFSPDESLVSVVSDSDGSYVRLKAAYTGDSSQGTGGYVTAGLQTSWRTTLTRGFNLCKNGVNSRIDIRARYNIGSSDQGNRPALWLLPYPEQPNPSGGEIDILEHPSHVADGKKDSDGNYTANHKAFSTIHNTYLYTDLGQTGGYQGSKEFTSATDYDWHLYTLTVTDNRYIRVYIDNERILEYDKNEYASSGYDSYHYWPFDQYDYYVLLTSMVPNSSTAYWDGPAAGTYDDVRMDVDYVRYYTQQ